MPLEGMLVTSGLSGKEPCIGVWMSRGRNKRSPGSWLECDISICGRLSAVKELSRPDVEEKTVDADRADTVEMRSVSSFSVMVDRHLASMSDGSSSGRLLEEDMLSGDAICNV